MATAISSPDETLVEFLRWSYGEVEAVERRLRSTTNPDQDVVRRLYRLRARLLQTVRDEDQTAEDASVRDDHARAVDDYSFSTIGDDPTVHLVAQTGYSPLILCHRVSVEPGLPDRPRGPLCTGCARAFISRMFPL